MQTSNCLANTVRTAQLVLTYTICPCLGSDNEVVKSG